MFAKLIPAFSDRNCSTDTTMSDLTPAFPNGTAVQPNESQLPWPYDTVNSFVALTHLQPGSSNSAVTTAGSRNVLDTNHGPMVAVSPSHELDQALITF